MACRSSISRPRPRRQKSWYELRQTFADAVAPLPNASSISSGKSFKRLGGFADWQHPYLTHELCYEATIVRELGHFFGARKGSQGGKAGALVHL